MKQWFLKDTWWLGIIIGIVTPVTFYSAAMFAYDVSGILMPSTFIEDYELLLIAINGILVRQFMMKWDRDFVARGIFLVTFAWVFYYVFRFVA